MCRLSQLGPAKEIRFVGAYASFPVDKTERRADVLERLLSLEGKLPFRKIRYGKISTKLQTETFSEAKLKKVRNSIASGNADWLYLLPYWKNSDWVYSYENSIYLEWTSSLNEPRERSPILERFGNAGTITITYPISRFSKDSESQFQRKLVNLFKDLFGRSELHWAFVHQGYRLSAPFSIGEDNVFLQTRDRFPLTAFEPDLNGYRRYFKEFIKGVFWANFLNPLHTIRLEDELQLLRKEPDVIVEDLFGKGTYIQLGPSPLPKDETSAAALYQRVRRYLKPVLLETPDDFENLQREVMGSGTPSGKL